MYLANVTMFAVFQARDSHTSFSSIFFRTASLYLHQPFVVSSVCESATASPRSCLTESMESNRTLLFGSFIVQVMQSVEIEKQQSRRLVSGDSLYHSLEYLALNFSPPKRLQWKTWFYVNLVLGRFPAVQDKEAPSPVNNRTLLSHLWGRF